MTKVIDNFDTELLALIESASKPTRAAEGFSGRPCTLYTLDGEKPATIAPDGHTAVTLDGTYRVSLQPSIVAGKYGDCECPMFYAC